MVDTIDLNPVVPYWLKDQRRWTKRGSPGSAIIGERGPSLVHPQRYFAPVFREIFNVGLIKEPVEGKHQVEEGWLFPQILRERPIINAVREALGLKRR